MQFPWPSSISSSVVPNILSKCTLFYHGGFCIFYVSICTLSDLGDLSNLIGSLSRTIQQYSPPSEWIMCELGFFPIFLEKDLLKVDIILGLTFFQARKDFEGFKTAFFHLWIVYNSCLFA